MTLNSKKCWRWTWPHPLKIRNFLSFPHAIGVSYVRLLSSSVVDANSFCSASWHLLALNCTLPYCTLVDVMPYLCERFAMLCSIGIEFIIYYAVPLLCSSFLNLPSIEVDSVCKTLINWWHSTSLQKAPYGAKLMLMLIAFRRRNNRI